jgi:hypothetical protein
MRLTSAIVLALALCASVASAQYTGPWTFQWDFDTSPQGWTVTGNGYWTDPAWVPPAGPTIADGAPSGGGNGNFYLPDGSRAWRDVSALNIGHGTVSGQPMNPFVYQVDVYIPNLRPMTGFTFGYPGNMIDKAGISTVRSGGTQAHYLVGDINKGGLVANDKTWDNTDRRSNWVLEELSPPPYNDWWDKWITLQIDYGVSTQGKWAAWAYIPWDSAVSTAGWILVGNGVYDVNANVKFDTLQMGAVGLHIGNSWTQAQFDNARLFVQGYQSAPIPEPVFFQLGALSGMGVLGLLRLRRKA